MTSQDDLAVDLATKLVDLLPDPKGMENTYFWTFPNNILRVSQASSNLGVEDLRLHLVEVVGSAVSRFDRHTWKDTHKRSTLRTAVELLNDETLTLEVETAVGDAAIDGDFEAPGRAKELRIPALAGPIDRIVVRNRLDSFDTDNEGTKMAGKLVNRLLDLCLAYRPDDPGRSFNPQHTTTQRITPPAAGSGSMRLT